MFHNLFTSNSHFVHIYFLYYFHKNKLLTQMINSKIAHRFFIIAPVVIQSGSPHFIRLLRAENSGSIFILYTRYFPPFQYIRPYFFFQPQPKRDGPSANMAEAVPFQSSETKLIKHQSSYTWSQVKSGSVALLSAFFVFFPLSSV